jgi:nuclear receptor interaction protein
VKTVKDVNYFGLQDEYVVSGSDSGHLFIWDKKTAQLVNILEGDGEVVNVVQGVSNLSNISYVPVTLTRLRPPI